MRDTPRELRRTWQYLVTCEVRGYCCRVERRLPLARVPRDLRDAKIRRGTPLLLGLSVHDYLHREFTVIVQSLLHAGGYAAERAIRSRISHLVVLRDLPFHALRAGDCRAVGALERSAGRASYSDGGGLLGARSSLR